MFRRAEGSDEAESWEIAISFIALLVTGTAEDLKF